MKNRNIEAELVKVAQNRNVKIKVKPASKGRKPEFDSLLIEPTIEARLAFVAEFIPKWMSDDMFDGDEIQVMWRLNEEVNDNFQFQSERDKELGLCEIIVMQQLLLQPDLLLKSLSHKKWMLDEFRK